MARKTRKKTRLKRRADSDTGSMPIRKAVKAIWDDNADSDWFFAALSIMENCERWSDVRIADLLKCLDRPGECAVMGARGLNIRSGRRSDEEIVLDDLTTDKQFWLNYLESVSMIEIENPQQESSPPPAGTVT